MYGDSKKLLLHLFHLCTLFKKRYLLIHCNNCKLQIHVSFNGIYERFCIWCFIFSAAVCTPACQNNGRCSARDGRPICVCPENFAGDYCETRKFSSASDFVSVLVAAWWLHTYIVILINIRGSRKLFQGGEGPKDVCVCQAYLR